MYGYGRAGWTLAPWRGFGELEDIMDGIFSQGVRTAEGRGFPAVNAYKEGEDVVLKAEVPGVRPEDIEISVEGRTITIRGERKAEPVDDKSTCHRRERWEGSFARTVELPFGIEAGRVEAKCSHGVLTVRLPRAEAERPRKIAVSLN